VAVNTILSGIGSSGRNRLPGKTTHSAIEQGKVPDDRS